MFYRRYMFVINNLCFKTKKEMRKYIERYNKRNRKQLSESDAETKLIHVHMVSVKEMMEKRRKEEGSY